MLIGAMNHPAEDVLREIQWMSEMGLDFLDLTLEPPGAASWQVNPGAIREALERSHLQVVGHTAFYLPIGSPIKTIREASVEELKRCLEVFSILHVKWMNVHPDRQSHMHKRKDIIEINLQTLDEVLTAGRRVGVGVMIENTPGHFNTADQLGQLLDPLPDLALHLDIGHANLHLSDCENSAPEIIACYGSRLRHVHLHDNKGGGADLHLPLGTGTLDVERQIRCLKRSGYDSTITLEVFAPDRHYLSYSRDVLRKLWDRLEAPA